MASVTQILKKCGCIFEIIAYILCIISILFLPYVTVGGKDSFSFFFGSPEKEIIKFNDFEGYIYILIIYIVSASIVIFNVIVIDGIMKKNRAIEVIMELIPLILTIISLILILTNEDKINLAIDAMNILAYNFAKKDIGYYLILISSIVAIVIRLLYVVLVKEIVTCGKEQAIKEENEGRIEVLY